MVPDFRASQKMNQNSDGILREEIKMRKGIQDGNQGRTEERVNLVDIRTEVTNGSNYVYKLVRVHYWSPIGDLDK